MFPEEVAQRSSSDRGTGDMLAFAQSETSHAVSSDFSVRKSHPLSGLHGDDIPQRQKGTQQSISEDAIIRLSESGQGKFRPAFSASLGGLASYKR